MDRSELALEIETLVFNPSSFHTETKDDRLEILENDTNFQTEEKKRNEKKCFSK